MLPTLLVTFREGIESFLIVGVITAYLRKTGHPGLIRGVKLGALFAVPACLAGAWFWMRVPNQPLYEGIAALVGALFVGTMLWQAMRAGRRLKGEIEARVGRIGPLSAPAPRLWRARARGERRDRGESTFS